MYGFKDDGKPNMVSFYGETKAEVRQKRQEYEEKSKKGLKKEKYTFSEFADRWLQRHQKNIQPATVESYKYTLRIINVGLMKEEANGVKNRVS